MAPIEEDASPPEEFHEVQAPVEDFDQMDTSGPDDEEETPQDVQLEDIEDIKEGRKVCLFDENCPL